MRARGGEASVRRVVPGGTRVASRGGEPVGARVEAGSEANMWLEAILSKGDLTKLVDRLLPLKIDVGGGTLGLHEPSEVEIVPEKGLRVRSKALVHWPVLGIDVPIALHELSVLICPEITPDDKLAFHVEIVHADLASVPNFVDVRITERLNTTLRERHTELTWDFAHALSHVFHFPEALSLAEALSLDVAWGRLRVMEEAIVLAVSFRADVVRETVDAARVAERAAVSR
jgi:hypothetical protein